MTSPNDLPSVGTEDARRLANWCEVMAAPPHSKSKAAYFESTAIALRNLVSERDALAGRVAELEAERDALPLRPEEQRAVLADPGMLVRLIGYHDAQEAAGEAFAEGWGKYHERRALELLAIGRKVIAEDPGIWEPEIIAEFKPRFSERAALSATTPESKP